jgi:cytochrome c
MTFRSLYAIPFALAATAAAVPVASAQNNAGEQLFRQRCQSCHTVTTGAAGTIGPNLRGVVGRKAAATKFHYSSALTSAKLTWTPQNLDRFLSGPAMMVPGTRMVVTIADPKQRADLITYLSSQR